MSAEQSVLYDVPGPKAIRRDLVFNIIFTALFIALFAYFAYAFFQRGIFDDRWAVLWDPPKRQTAGDVWYALLVRGLGATMLAAVIATPAAVLLGGALAALRRGIQTRWVTWPVAVTTEVFRGLPVLLMMVLARFGFNWDGLWSVVFGLVVYNMAVVAEILRAGLAALPKGQREAGLSVGLRPLQTVLLIEMPQAIRIMLPALVSQLVVLLKDSSLGFIIAYPELLRQVRLMREYFGDRYTIPVFFVGAVIYIAINIVVSRLAVWLEGRMRRTKKVATTGSGDDGLAQDNVESARMVAAFGRSHTEGHLP